MNRETIYQALFDRVKNLSGLVTASRRARLAKEVAPEEMPALFQEQLPETVHYQGQGLPSEHLLRADLIIYVAATDPHEVVSTRLNALIDAAIAALAPAVSEEEQTLDNLVTYCRINGDIEVNEGVVSGSPLAIIPVEILAV